MARAELPQMKIARRRLSEQVAQQLQELVSSGTLQPGDRLPSERELARQLGVSRTVVREATKSLEQRGLVEVLTGSGTYVSEMEPKVVSDSIALLIEQSASSFDHLHEVRRLLETEIAGLAAERATPEDVQAMEGIAQEMEIAIARGEQDHKAIQVFVEADLAFHNALAEAAHNPLLPLLLAPLTNLLLEFRRLASEAPGAPEDAVKFHRSILEQVKAQDPSACRELMQQHLISAEEWENRAQSQPESSHSQVPR